MADKLEIVIPAGTGGEGLAGSLTVFETRTGAVVHQVSDTWQVHSLAYSPDGQRIAQIRLPEICANVCFGGARRNRLVITCSQYLMSIYVTATGMQRP